jgi:23S rRNA pseudouridine2604 synthase
MIKKKEQFPMRINKYLAWKQLATRREADTLIEKKLVTINGRLAKLGDKVVETDKVILKESRRAKRLVYLAFNKPRGVVTVNPEAGQTEIKKFINTSEAVFPIGRLDKASHGLIILTNDGRVTDRLLNPKQFHEKEYLVEVDHKYSPSFLRHMEGGVNIEGYRTKKATAARVNERKFRIILTEGKKHQIRRMCIALGYQVTDLERVRIMNINLGNLPAGQTRPIEGLELEEFLKLLDLSNLSTTKSSS